MPHCASTRARSEATIIIVAVAPLFFLIANSLHQQQVRVIGKGATADLINYITNEQNESTLPSAIHLTGWTKGSCTDLLKIINDSPVSCTIYVGFTPAISFAKASRECVASEP